MSGSTVNLRTDSPEARKVLEKAMYLYKVAFDQIGRQTGASMRYVNQHSMLWGGIARENFTRWEFKGVCAGLAVQWIKASAKGEDFINELMRARDAIFVTNKNDNDEGAFANWALQDFADTVWDSHRLQNNLTDAFRGVMNLSRNAISVQYPYTSLPQAMKAGHYVYLGTSGHAMAARVGTAYFTTSKVDFYDPNVGEMRGTTKEGVARYVAKCQQLTATEVTGKPLSSLTDNYMEVQNMTKVFFGRG